MKKSIIVICIMVVLGCFLIDDSKCLHQKEINQIDLKQCQKLMIVAHPDDETIWGGSHLLKGHYLVVCLTNGNNEKRKKEFMRIMKETHNQGLMFDYPDKTNGQRDKWLHVKQKIKKDITYILNKKAWAMVVTHNPLGEYGHIHHRLTSQIVSIEATNQNLYYFGKYYKKKHVPHALKKIKQKNYDKKMQLIQKYASQKKVMEHLDHMMNHENWGQGKRLEKFMKEKIMIVDDHEDIREVVHVLLTNEGYQIIEAKDGKEALELLDDEIDLIILDVMMPEMNGYQACLLMREKTNAPILFLTAKGQESDKTLGFSSGGDDYLTKPFSYNELNARVKALLRRYHVYQGKEKEISSIRKISIIENLEVNQEHKEVKLNGKKLSLTDLEYEILDYLLLNRKQVISASQLFEAIWHENYYYGANNTIMVHIRNLRKKIEDDPQNPRIIKTVWGKGYYID